MSPEENKAIVRRYFKEVHNKRNLDVIDELFAPNYVRRHSGKITSRNLEEFKQQARHPTFSDWHVTIQDMVAEGDKVVVRTKRRGTHHREVVGVAPTGKQVTYTGIAVFRIEGGRIVEQWAESAGLSVLHQLGVVGRDVRVWWAMTFN